MLATYRDDIGPTLRTKTLGYRRVHKSQQTRDV